jgi:hypothetical protein
VVLGRWNSGARAELAKHLSASRRQGLERTTAAAVFELLPQTEAVRIFSALAPYFAERDRLGRASPAALERLSAQLERSFPKPPSSRDRATAVGEVCSC